MNLRNALQSSAVVVLGIALTISAAAQQPAEKGGNLLTNGDFSKGLEGWNFDPHAKKGQVSIDSVEVRNGKPTLRIENPAADDSQLSQKVTVKPATRYRLIGWIKAKNVGSAASKAGASLSIKASFSTSEVLTKNAPWKHVSLDITTVGESELAVGPRLGAFGAMVPGTAWYAELELKEVGPARH